MSGAHPALAVGADTLEQRLARLPRLPLAAAPTPLQEAPRLSAALAGPRILVKRDDLTGLMFGGNKVRQMEFVLGDSLAQAADVFICGGAGPQSNHARVGAAAARVAGLQPVVVVEPRDEPAAAVLTGNALLVRLLGADVRVAPELGRAPAGRLAELGLRRAVMERIAAEYRARGHVPYVLPGSSIPLAVLGYVAASLELERQCQAQGVRPDVVFVSSSAATQAGLELGRRLLGAPYRIVGIGHTPGQSEAPRWIAHLAAGAADLLGLPGAIAPGEIEHDGAYAGPGHGVLTGPAREALALLARTEGLPLDPVYTAKAMAGLIGWVRGGRLGPDQTVILVHTGGLPALFAYAEDLF
jgi:L-cysteate sulfo-lyase